MFRALLIAGAALDIALALFLLLVFGFVIDSWQDPNGRWVGVVVTTAWLIAFVLCGGAPILAYRMSRSSPRPGRLALVVWFPFLAIVACTILLQIVFSTLANR
jgi:amino acid transporter